MSMASYVLLIEVDEVTRNTVAELLRGEGYSVVEETDSAAAVSRVMEHAPGLVIMAEDLLPLDDVELLAIVRRLTRAPIIVMGTGGEAPVVKALLEGADMYVRKPVNNRELLSRVRALIRRSSPE